MEGPVRVMFRGSRKMLTVRYEAKISSQLARLGGSHDWDKMAFTMSEVGQLSIGKNVADTQGLSKAVTEAFVTLHERKLIYRANRLVNWCVYLNTSLSNLEVCSLCMISNTQADVQVDSLSLTGRTLMNVKGYDPKERFEFGVITSFAYPIEDSGMS